ncbi:hypothetical protein D1007_31265 [Hordeum vulgare]|nr:hypothetical protein D1007_31265 [Hordeum vulgare]
MGFFFTKDKGKSPVIPVRVPASFRPPRQRVSVPVHQARWHWEHRARLPNVDVTLSHDWHLDPKRITVSAVPQSAMAHEKEVRHRQEELTPEQRRNPVDVADSPD